MDEHEEHLNELRKHAGKLDDLSPAFKKHLREQWEGHIRVLGISCRHGSPPCRECVRRERQEAMRLPVDP